MPPPAPRTGGEQPGQRCPQGAQPGGSCGEGDMGPCSGDSCVSPSPPVPVAGAGAARSPVPRLGGSAWRQRGRPLSRREVGSRKPGPAPDKGPVYIQTALLWSSHRRPHPRGGHGMGDTAWGDTGCGDSRDPRLGLPWGVRQVMGIPCAVPPRCGAAGTVPWGCAPWFPLARVGCCDQTLSCHRKAGAVVPCGLPVVPSTVLGIAAHP